MRYVISTAAILLILVGLGQVLALLFPHANSVIEEVWEKRQTFHTDISAEEKKEKKIAIKSRPASYTLSAPQFVAQTFNNCGPATLSMILSMFGKHISQEELAEKMRPFNNPVGVVDDKSIFAHEFVSTAEGYGFKALHRPNGDIELLKKFVANDIPVIVRTWLNDYEDIGHFRIVRGYDSAEQNIIVDDSYQGLNLHYSYDDFHALWQPFNYGYILVYPAEKQALVEAILDEEKDEKVAYQNALSRAEKELKDYCRPDPELVEGEGSQDSSPSTVWYLASFRTQNDTKCAYAQFNVSTSQFYLGDYEKSVAAYEKAAPNLPWRMMWYQYEPIQAYHNLKNHNRVFELTDSILYNGNLAYSELYQIRGEIFEEQSNPEAAQAEFEKAVYYNKNFIPAQQSLSSL